MEGGEENSLCEILENSPNFWLASTPSITSIDSLLSAQDCNSPNNQLLSTVTNHPTPLFQPTEIFDFSTDDATTNYLGVVSELPSPKTQTTEFINELLNEYLNSNSGVVSSDGDKDSEKKGSSTWYKGHWKQDEDSKLISLVEQHGYRKWAVIAKEMPGRIGKQCRERWQNHLRPNIKKNLVWTEEEERMIIEAHERLGNRWAEIAKCVPNRSENAIKNHWNATKRKLNSKRRIMKPERLQGFPQSNLLEEYIKKKYFRKRSISSSAAATITPTASAPLTTPINQNNGLIPMNLPPAKDPDSDNDSASYFIIESVNEEMNLMENLSGNNNVNTIAKDLASSTPDADDDSTSYFTTETVDEEMSFMRNLFGSINGNSNEVNASYNEINISSSNFSINTPTINAQRHMENVGNGLIASFSEPNMEQIGGNRDIPMQEAQDYADFTPEIYFNSYAFEGSFGNIGSNVE